MNPTYMKHPLNGAMIVYDHGALERAYKTGWVLDENQPDGGIKPEKPALRVVGVDVDGDGKIDKAFAPRKPGRPKKGE